MTRFLPLIVSSLLSISTACARPPAEWPFKPWNEAVAVAKAEKKPLFVLFGYESCEWCRVLYRGGMNDPDVLSKYRSSLVLTYVDTEATSEDARFVLPEGTSFSLKDLLDRYRVYPVPSWVYLSETGVLLNSDRGGRTTSRELLRDIEIALSKQAKLLSVAEVK